MFKKTEAWWNARTPVYLHNGTKENFAFQLALTAVVLGVLYAYDAWEDRSNRKKYPALYAPES